MNTEKERILVIGAGVNGSVCAAAFFEAGLDVRILARGHRIAEIRDAGIVIEDPFKKSRRVAKVSVIDRLDPEDLYDYILVVVRNNQVAELLPTLAANCSPNIVFMGNDISGPARIALALGPARAMLGFVIAAGRREGGLIRAMVMKSAAVRLGEIGGAITPRLERLAGIFGEAGFKTELCAEIEDYLLSHAAGVALIAGLVLAHDLDLKALARSTEELRLFVLARREAHEVIRALGRRVVPRSEEINDHVPVFLQVAVLRLLLNSKFGEVGLAWHCSQAPDEIRELIAGLRALVEKAGIPAPAMGKLLGLRSPSS
jgi:2-dehydropantoate 2-reductase